MWTWVPCHVVLIATILCYIFIKCRESCCYTVVAFLYDNLNSLNIRNNYFILFYYQLCVDIFCQDEKGIWNNKSVLILLEYIIIQLMRKNKQTIYISWLTQRWKQNNMSYKNKLISYIVPFRINITLFQRIKAFLILTSYFTFLVSSYLFRCSENSKLFNCS